MSQDSGPLVVEKPMKTSPACGKHARSISITAPIRAEAWQIMQPMAKRYWLMKSEPETYSIDDLKKQGWTHWEGVRNYQARNTMRDDMKIGDGVLFYHSNCKPPGVVGIAKVSKESYPDHTAFEKKSNYFDAKSDPDNPRWMMVDVAYISTLKRTVSLNEMKEVPGLSEMLVIRKGMRLSVQEVTKDEFQIVKKLGNSKAP
jgi:predicted RNA-binding protein with PUA-like domain